MKVGDLVTDDRSHMDKTNLFYDAWLRYGLILEWNDESRGWATVMWWRHGKLEEINTKHVSMLEVVNEGR